MLYIMYNNIIILLIQSVMSHVIRDGSLQTLLNAELCLNNNTAGLVSVLEARGLTSEAEARGHEAEAEARTLQAEAELLQGANMT